MTVVGWILDIVTVDTSPFWHFRHFAEDFKVPIRDWSVPFLVVSRMRMKHTYSRAPCYYADVDQNQDPKDPRRRAYS